MEARTEKRGDTLAIYVSGRLDTMSATEFQKIIDNIPDSDAVHVEIDCKALDYISSSGLRAFITIMKRTQRNGGETRVVNLNDNVKEVFDMTGFSVLFGI